MTNPNYSQQTFHGDKKRFPTKNGFPKNPTAYTLLNKVSQKHHYFGAKLIFQSNHLKVNTPCISEHSNILSISFQF